MTADPADSKGPFDDRPILDQDGGAGPPGSAAIGAGQRIGDLQLLREIGRGAQGIVFEGRQLSIDRTVAVKVVAKDLTFGEEQIERFHREAEANGRLSHPNIVAVYGLVETEHHMLLLQELVTGGSLADVLDEDGSDDVPDARGCRRAASACAKLAAALQHAHEHGVIHRDVKPDNVLMTEDGEPKLTDFGLARMDHKLGLSRTGAIMGTPHFMSPEQVTADPSAIDARADVYSLGCLLYRILTGRVPIEGKTLQSTFHNILSMPPRPLRGLNPAVSADLEAVCLKALRKSRDERYASAGELADDLRRYLGGQTTLARPEGTLVRTVRLLRRQSSTTLALIVLLVPTAWIALDALWLAPWSRQQIELHSARLGVAGLATLLFGWPLTYLAGRLLRRRALALGAAWLLALAAGGLAGWTIREQRLDLLQGAERAVLEARLDLDAAGARIDVSDLIAYADAWGPRFGPTDALLMARGFLERERPHEAAAWAGRLDAGLLDTPVQDALAMAIDETLGRSAAAAEAERRLIERQEADWSDWKLAGDILRDMGRPDVAYDAYLRAGRQPDAPRDALNLELAEVSADLCHWTDVEEYLDDYLKWFPDEPVGKLVLHFVAALQGRWSLAQDFLDRYARSAGVTPAQVLRHQHKLWSLQGRRGECWALVQRAVDEHADDASLLGWCAAQALAEQRVALSEASAAASAGDARGAADGLALASRALDVAEQAYDVIARGEHGRFASQVGLSAVAMARADVEPERRLEWLERAAESAAGALELDPSYWQAHYNLGHARLNAARTRAGSFAAVPLEALQEYVDFMRAAIDLNGLATQPLNNAAWVLGRYVYAATGERADLEEALELARRAVWLTDPARGGGACVPEDATLSSSSSAHDTLRSLQELAGDLEGALLSARRARDVLDLDAAERPRRDGEVLRLEGLLSEGR